MRFLFYMIIASVLAAQNTQSCYTVQLLSKFNNASNKNILSYEKYPTECKLMEIGKNITLRCGCYEHIASAQKKLPQYKKEYKKAYIATTYRYRFDEKTQVPKAKKEKKKKDIPLEIIDVFVENNHSYMQDSSGKLNKISALKIMTKNENKRVVKKSKKAKKKKKKNKNKSRFVKKSEGEFFYDDALRSFKGTYQSSKLAGEYGTGDLDFKYRFGAQISYDFGYVNEAEQSYTNGEFRRIRIYNKGSFYDESLFYELEYSFTGNNNIKDIYLGYQNSIDLANMDYRFKIGNIKIPFSLETYSTSKNITFMERALTDSFADNRKLGIELLLSKEIEDNYLNWFVSGYSNSLNERSSTDEIHNGYASRLTYAHKFRKNHLISFGGAVMSRNIDGDTLKFNQGTESSILRDKYVSVKINDVDTTLKKNIEALYINDEYSLQGEYISTDVNALKDNYNFLAYYIQASYFIFGKGRRYDLNDSSLKKVKPKKGGSLEFALRYSYIDLNDKDEHGGTQSDMNYALNWYLSKEFKVMLNYVVSKPKGTDDYDGLLQILQTRLLFAF